MTEGQAQLSEAQVLGGCMYHRILVVAGDQPGNNAAVGYAVALAATTGAELSILTVLLPPSLLTFPTSQGPAP
jgi:nucleotide-binding universal stress UspA family protein